MPAKCVLLILDGLGDRSHSVLGDKTPLQAAHTPTLDRLAGLGANGLYHAFSVGHAPPSENAHFVMFGYDMAEFPGRGALEALGAGIPLDTKEVAVLAHFARVRETDGYLVLEDDTPSASEEESKALLEAVGEYEADGVGIRFTPTTGLFGILKLRGDVSPYFADTGPMVNGRALSEVKPWRDYANDAPTQRTAKALKAYLLWAYQRLKEHPVNASRVKKGLPPINAVVTQRAGRLKPVTAFRERNGMKALSISAGIIYWGLCAYLGIDVKKMKDTDDPGADIAERLQAAREALADYDLVHVHTKAPDEAAHTKDPLAKKSVIEALDSGIGKAIEPLLDDPEVLLVVTSDHSTPSAGSLIHSGETVPLAMVGEGVRRDEVKSFDEISAAAGALGRLRGKELMYLILNHLDRARLMGIMDTPVDQPYFPGDCEPFRVE